MHRYAIATMAAGLLLAGCQSRPPHADYPPAPPPAGGPQRTGAAPATPPPARSVVLGGPVGVIAAAQVGGYMDNQERDLRARLRASGVRVARIGNDIVLMMQDDIVFQPHTTSLSRRALQTLDEVAGVLRQYGKTLIEVNGYTDTTGSDAYNLRLSQRRAESVADVLVDDGINAARISPRGFGESHLAVPTGNNVDEPRNRRMEIRIVPHVAEG